jgi:hypothetical protein
VEPVVGSEGIDSRQTPQAMERGGRRRSLDQYQSTPIKMNARTASVLIVAAFFSACSSFRSFAASNNDFPIAYFVNALTFKNDNVRYEVGFTGAK